MVDVAVPTGAGVDGEDGATGDTGAAGAAGGNVYHWNAGYHQVPNIADWGTPAVAAPVVADSNNNGLPVWLFPLSPDQAIGGQIYVPTGMTNLRFRFLSRSEEDQDGDRTVGIKWQNRNLVGVPGSWTTAYALTDLTMPDGEGFVKDNQLVTISALGLTAGDWHQVKLFRTDPAGGTELAVAWALAGVRMELS